MFVGVIASLCTLFVTVRTQLELRRRWPSFMWGFDRYGERALSDGRRQFVTELTQLGGTPNPGCRILYSGISG